LKSQVAEVIPCFGPHDYLPKVQALLYPPSNLEI
jgi:hypothetical protein